MELKDELEEVAKAAAMRVEKGLNELKLAELKKVAEPVKSPTLHVLATTEAVKKKEDEYPPGFLPRPNEHKVYGIGEDDYTFEDLIFREGRKKERERWRSLKSRMDNSSEPELEGDRVKKSGRQPGEETSASCSTKNPG